MKHVYALIIKYIMVTVMLYIVLGLFYRVGFGDILFLSLIVTALIYLLGDLLVLPMGGNVMATVADFAIALVAVWLVGGFWLNYGISIVPALYAAILIGAGEWFFHKYLVGRIVENHVNPSE